MNITLNQNLVAFCPQPLLASDVTVSPYSCAPERGQRWRRRYVSFETRAALRPCVGTPWRPLFQAQEPCAEARPPDPGSVRPTVGPRPALGWWGAQGDEEALVSPESRTRRPARPLETGKRGRLRAGRAACACANLFSGIWRKRAEANKNHT